MSSSKICGFLLLLGAMHALAANCSAQPLENTCLKTPTAIGKYHNCSNAEDCRGSPAGLGGIGIAAEVDFDELADFAVEVDFVVCRGVRITSATCRQGR